MEELNKRLLKAILNKAITNHSVEYLSIRYEEALYQSIKMDQELSSSEESGYFVTLKKKHSEVYEYYSTDSSVKLIEYFANDVPDLNLCVNFNLYMEYKEKEFISNETLIEFNDLLKLVAEQDLVCSSINYSKYRKKHTFIDTNGKDIVQDRKSESFYIEVGLANSNIQEFLPISIRDKKNIFKYVENQILNIKKTLDSIDKNEVITPNGVFDVILNPSLAGVFFHETVGHPSEADTYNVDVLNLGSKISIDELEIWDVPLSYEGYEYDEEGTKSESIKIVEKGIFKNLLHRNLTTSKANYLVGNGRATDFKNVPICRMRQTKIMPGKYTEEQLISNVENGLYLVGYKDAATFGDYFYITCNYGFYIEKGRLTKIFPSVKISGSIKESLTNIKAIANNGLLISDAGGCNKLGQNGLANEMFSPSVFISNIKIGENIEYE